VKGISQFTPEYFDEMDTALGFKKGAPVVNNSQPAPAAPAAPQRRSVQMTAPVSREVPTSSGERQSTGVTLTAEERAIARSAFTDPTGKMTNADKERLYAMNKLKLQRERAAGRYPARERA
jgi:hypothetical protein